MEPDMAENEHPGGKIAKYSVTNNARGVRTVNRPDGSQVSIQPRGQVTVEMTAAEAKSARTRDDLDVQKVGNGPKPDETKPAPAPAGGGANEGGEGGTGDDADKAVTYVAHHQFGQYFGYNAADQQVEGAGPWKKDEAQTWATENKVEFRTGAQS